MCYVNFYDCLLYNFIILWHLSFAATVLGSAVGEVESISVCLFRTLENIFSEIVKFRNAVETRQRRKAINQVMQRNKNSKTTVSSSFGQCFNSILLNFATIDLMPSSIFSNQICSSKCGKFVYLIKHKTSHCSGWTCIKCNIWNHHIWLLTDGFHA